MNLLLAAVLLLQDKTAEETFKKIETQIETAKTVSLKFKIEVSGKPEHDGTGTILFKGGNKSFIEIKGGGWDLTGISDGVKTYSCWGGFTPTVTEANKNQKRNISITFARLGIIQSMTLEFFLGVRITMGDQGKKPVEDDFRKLFEVFDIKAGEDDKESKTLTYKVKVPDDRVSADAKVWYDPKTFMLSKLTASVNISKSISVVTETYEEFTLNADIPDERFKLPEKK